MKWNQMVLGALFALLLVFNSRATVLYVDLNCTNPTPPYGGWSTAATNIQDAIDAATNGDLILVTNGVYDTGGRTINGYALTNRVVINKAVTVQSVNGPAATMIQGFQVQEASWATNAYLAVRCVYLTNNALLAGFTLTNGGTWWGSSNASDRNGAGAWCETNAMMTNCVITAGYSVDSGGGAYQGNYYNCAFISNSAIYFGGGAYNSALVDCTLTGNFQLLLNYGSGGGAYSCTLSNCNLSGNHSASDDDGSGDDPGGGGGGGANLSVLNNCELIGNSGYSGGGAYLCSLNNCMVVSNSAAKLGGGNTIAF